MSNIDSNKNLAGIGAILFALGFIPEAGVVIGIIGLILLMIGLKGIAEHYQEQGIYQNALTGVIFGIIGLIIVAALSFGSILGSWFSISSVGASISYIVLSVVALIFLFIFYLLMAINFRKAFNLLAQKTGNHTFETAGLLLFIGAILTIIVVGLVLVFIAFLLASVAFFSMSSLPPSQTSSYSSTASTTSIPSATRYCSNCGAPINNPAAQYCPHCGTQLS